MNLAAVGSLATTPDTGIWYRVIPPRYVKTALHAGYTKVIPSRFSDGSGRFEILYFSDSPQVAMFEMGALLGPYIATGPVPNPRISMHVQSFRLTLGLVAHLDDVASHALLQTSAQELAGDWEAYRLRAPHYPVPWPVGPAPTQLLGGALFSHTAQLEGFTFASAKMGMHRNIAVFTQNMRVGHAIDFDYDDGNGSQPYRYDGTLP